MLDIYSCELNGILCLYVLGRGGLVLGCYVRAPVQLHCHNHRFGSVQRAALGAALGQC